MKTRNMFSLCLVIVIFFMGCKQTSKPMTEAELLKAQQESSERISEEFKNDRRRILGEPNCAIFKEIDSLLTSIGEEEIPLGIVKRSVWPYDSCAASIGYEGDNKFNLHVIFVQTKSSPGMTFILNEYCYTDYFEIPTQGLTISPRSPFKDEMKSPQPFYLALEKLKEIKNKNSH